MNEIFNCLNIKYNQKQYAEAIYNNGFSSLDKTKYSYETKLLLLYLRDSLQMKPKQREDYIYQFIEKYNPNFNVVLEYRHIDKALRWASNKKHKLKDIGCIDIYSAEIDYIKNLEIEENYKKILFVLLVQGKLNVLSSGIEKYPHILFINEKYFSQNMLKKQIGCSETKGFTVTKALRDLQYKYNLINLDRNNNYYLLFTQNIMINNSSMILSINDYDNLGYYYDYLCGNKNIGFCKKCGKIFKKRTVVDNRRIYCAECSKYQKIPYKIIICCECGKEFAVETSIKHKYRCEECQKNNIKYKDRIRKRID